MHELLMKVAGMCLKSDISAKVFVWRSMENELVLSSLELFYEYKQGQYNGLDSRIAVNNIKALIDKITNKNTTSLISVWFVYIKRCQPTMVDMSHHLAFLKSQ